MTNSQRQHGIGSLAPDEKIVGKPGGLVEPGVKQYGIFKKIKRAAKKVFKSKLGKAAMLGLGAYYMPGIGAKAAGGWGPWASKIGSGIFGTPGTIAGEAGRSANIFSRAKAGLSKFGYGKSALLGLGAAGMIMPFLAQKDDEEEDEPDWSVTPSSIANIRNMARAQDPSLAFLPPENYTQ